MTQISLSKNSSSRDLSLLALVVGYILFTYFLFLIAPFFWPVPSHPKLFLVVMLSLTSLCIGYFFGFTKGPINSKSLPVKWISALGGLAAFVVLFPSAQIYAGRWPWEVLDALSDQKAAYQGLGDQLRETTGQRGYIAAARALTAPLAFAAVVIGILNWKMIGALGKFGVGLAIISSLIFSILRGTNKEVVDTTIIILSTLMILRARNSDGKLLFKRRSTSNFRNAARIAGIFMVLSMVIITFVVRISARLGFSDSLCIGMSGICADFNTSLYYYLPIDVSRSMAFITAYLGQGYFGLSLALEEPFKSGFGLAHSPAISSLYIQLGGNEEFIRETYPYRLAYQAWDPEVQWTSLLTWIAADISFPGAVAAIGILGYALARSWKSAVQGNNDLAAGIFIIAILACFYFPANFQATITLDSYFVLLAFVAAYKFWRFK